MKSLRSVSVLSIIVVLIFSAGALFGNFIFVPEMRHFLERNDESIELTQKQLGNMEIAVRVLNNIYGIIKRDGVVALTENQHLAYHDNVAFHAKAVEQMEQLLLDFRENLQRMNQWSLRRHNDLVMGSMDIIEQIEYELSACVQLSLIEEVQPETIIALNEAHVLIIESVENLRLQNNVINKIIFKDIMIVINTVVILLIAFTALLGGIVIRFVTIDLRYIVSAFRAIERNHYDIEALPRIKMRFEEEKSIHNLVEDIMEESQFTSRVRDVLMQRFVVDDVISSLFDVVHERMGIDRIGIAFVDYHHQKIIAEYGVAHYDKILLGPGFEVGFEQTSLSRIITTKESFITPDLEEAFKEKPKSAALNLLRREGILSNMVVPLTMGDGVFGMIFFSSTKRNHFGDKELKLAEKIIYEVSGLLNRSYFTKVILSKITTSFSQLVDKKDNDTGDHIERMVQYAVAIAMGLREKNEPGYEITKRDILEIERNASVHDIGKVGVPDDILKKPAKLSPEEWTIMKTHVDIGADIFASLRAELRIFDDEFFKVAEEITRYHHEKWDGSGYPRGLKGQAIPLSARIVAIADVFDALSSKRVYKGAFGFEESVDIIREGSGHHFDPFIVTVFEENLKQIRHIYDRR